MEHRSHGKGRMVLLAVLALGAGMPWLLRSESRDAVSTVAGAEVVVYRAPSCVCCRAWVDHLEEAGFTVRVEERSDMLTVKRDLGVPRSLYSCHTSRVGGRVVEGHVPAAVLRRYFRIGAPGAGLAVPGMPRGSPGMHGSSGPPFRVFLYDDRGRVSLFEPR